ncbi:DUF2786 domain-containing protein [Phytohabitans aurantiacus]|uniref:DUF2786 domain-containing protein n=1 Tax=Phytohabitans aurantiacus TaxID=3016789 RepID=A0ABQ5QUH5_9ACTN|nr:DUF2786 domain-containing protein [Phytohabitans aurantiacus]GLH97364.1 hypothetical protein Pa4123_26390 [Phytohabitans aurantiacus]
MTTTDAPEKMLARIRALLTKAEDPAATPEEAETYTAKAAELMAKYGVDRAMLAAADPTSDTPGDRIITVQAPYALDKQRLLSQVGMALGCKTVLKRGWDGRYSVHLFGYASDLERVDMLFTSLLLQAVNGMTQTWVPYGESAAAFRRSWLAGFAAMIARRLQQAEQRAAANAAQEREQTGTGGPSVALVLADRATVVQRKLEEAYPKLGKARHRKLSGSGYRDGVEAGRRADLGGPRVGNGRRAALGG